REEAESSDTASIARLQERLATLDAELVRRADDQRQRCDDLASHGEAVASRIAGLGATIAGIAGHGADAEERLGDALQALSRNLADSRDALTGTDARIAELTDASVRLLELIQAGVQHSSHDLPAALATGEDRLGQLERRIFLLRDTVDQARGGSADLAAHVLATNDGLSSAQARIAELAESLRSGSSAQGEALSGLAERLAAIDAQTRALADVAQDELSRAIEVLTQAAREAVATISESGSQAITSIAADLGVQSGQAIEAAMRERAAEAALSLEKAAAQAAHVSREAATQLRDQLAMVNELAGNLEQRVAHARARAEEQVDNDFARRVALITESLNSNAIDIAKALSTDVSDTAWSAYLKGDRGIFTRRAVSLLDNADARAVLQLYEADGEFRDHVSRFIHDFEAMLRQVLSTRDGHALGVTLLSADMGKLYVALAQSIERLRA
ncbi:MAG TPA: ATPase, partial [Novosphingobium sp.]|nr:ATPase [Novosphingobium sp.]